VDQLFDISGKTALVTGGAGDIGRAIADLFVRRGVRTYICGRNAQNCADMAAELSRHGECHGLQADLGNLAGIQRLAAEILAREDHLDILVNNAGAAHYAGIDVFPESAWDEVFDINLKAPFFLSQAFLPALRKAGTAARPARIINIGSSAGSQVSTNEAYAYSTSKSALNYLTRKIARRLAKDNITVNTVAPGPVEAGLMSKMDEAFRRSVRDEIPLGRMATADEVAAAVVFLASPAAAYLTGVILPVDGGVAGCMR
jgi:NAD(P)-dependent dehydrogenase (short-subunit alcohol dehydrogenase family)